MRLVKEKGEKKAKTEVRWEKTNAQEEARKLEQTEEMRD